MYIFMNMCFIKDWEDESCHLRSVNLFHYFRCSVRFSTVYWEKIAFHHVQFTVISHRLSSSRKNYIYSKVITRTYLCILTCLTMNIFEDNIFQHVRKKEISSCAKMKITFLAETLAISAIWTLVWTSKLLRFVNVMKNDKKINAIKKEWSVHRLIFFKDVFRRRLD